MIPDEKMDAVSRGLRAAFGGTEAVDIESIRQTNQDGGPPGADLLFRIVVRGEPLLLRILTRIDAERNDPARIFACMEGAARVGVAPRVRHANASEGIVILDWVERVDLPVGRAAVEVPGLLRKLHALQPPFPKAFNWVTPHRFFIWKLRERLREEADAAVFRCYEEICKVYPRVEADLVSCHMDLRPENLLYDGERIWLGDWSAAFVNDRYFDLAVAANFLEVHGDGEEGEFLARYWGRAAAGEYEMARFFLMRQVVHMLSAAVYLMLGMAGNAMRTADGRVHWERLRENVQGPRMEAALGVVAGVPGTGGFLLPVG